MTIINYATDYLPLTLDELIKLEYTLDGQYDWLLDKDADRDDPYNTSYSDASEIIYDRLIYIRKLIEIKSK